MSFTQSDITVSSSNSTFEPSYKTSQRRPFLLCFRLTAQAEEWSGSWPRRHLAQSKCSSRTVPWLTIARLTPKQQANRITSSNHLEDVTPILLVVRSLPFGRRNPRTGSTHPTFNQSRHKQPTVDLGSLQRRQHMSFRFHP
jgi:hypothetical protein